MYFIFTSIARGQLPTFILQYFNYKFTVNGVLHQYGIFVFQYGIISK